MKSKLILVLIFLSSYTKAQPCRLYSYDQAGNRYSRIAANCRLASPNDSLKEQYLKMDYGLSIFPNPTSEGFNVQIINLKEDDKATLYLSDVQGKLILTKEQVLSQNFIDLKNLSSGLYYLRVVINKEQLVYKIQKY